MMAETLALVGVSDESISGLDLTVHLKLKDCRKVTNKINSLLKW
jgi:hypothetical protein